MLHLATVRQRKCEQSAAVLSQTLLRLVCSSSEAAARHPAADVAAAGGGGRQQGGRRHGSRKLQRQRCIPAGVCSPGRCVGRPADGRQSGKHRPESELSGPTRLE